MPLWYRLYCEYHPLAQVMRSLACVSQTDVTTATPPEKYCFEVYHSKNVRVIFSAKEFSVAEARPVFKKIGIEEAFVCLQPNMRTGACVNCLPIAKLQARIFYFAGRGDFPADLLPALRCRDLSPVAAPFSSLHLCCNLGIITTLIIFFLFDDHLHNSYLCRS